MFESYNLGSRGQVAIFDAVPEEPLLAEGNYRLHGLQHEGCRHRDHGQAQIHFFLDLREDSFSESDFVKNRFH